MSAGLDPGQARLARRPLPPADRATLTRPVLAETGRRVARRATEMGLTRWFWGEGVVLLGMLRLADALGRPVPAFVTEFVDRHLDEPGLDLGHVNNLAPGAACVRLLAETGEPRYERACEQMLTWLGTHATRAPGGAFEHWPGGVWADTVFMSGVFLLHYGRLTGRTDPIDEARRQLLTHAEILRDPETGLYAHGSHRGETIPCFWGRANAWTALAGVEFLETAEAVGADATEDGTLTRTSAGTVLQLVPFGYSVIRDDLIQPWGQGLAMHAYAAALTEPTERHAATRSEE